MKHKSQRTVSFPTIDGGRFSSLVDMSTWTFQSLTDTKGATRYHIIATDKHRLNHTEVTRTTFLKIKRELSD